MPLGPNFLFFLIFFIFSNLPLPFIFAFLLFFPLHRSILPHPPSPPSLPSQLSRFSTTVPFPLIFPFFFIFLLFSLHFTPISHSSSQNRFYLFK
ncbi:unnamed protein product [Meloidogyne enterolobii]|uniref:Uncharacterized protein n=1 Tax=Meloidogyne enterolobii TaxID=390850 RepID=A0ACB0XUS5_MELEN